MISLKIKNESKMCKSPTIADRIATIADKINV